MKRGRETLPLFVRNLDEDEHVNELSCWWVPVI